MQSCSRRIVFCYGHRLIGHAGKCATLHGHNGILEIHATPIGSLDTQGMVIDFSVLKNTVGGWIEEHWDHNTILSEEDTETLRLIRQCPGKKQPFVLPYNPTSENLVHYLLYTVCPKLLQGKGIIVHKIVLHETENCSAEECLNPKDPDILALYTSVSGTEP